MAQWTGVRKHGRGWQAWVSVRRVRDSATFPPDTSPDEMQEWREKRRAELVLQVGQRPARQTFANDAIRYLQTVKAMPTYKERRTHILEWVAIFGTKRRHLITPAEIRKQRDAWLSNRRVVVRNKGGKEIRETGPPYAPNTVNKRLRALSNLWTVLDGPRAHNPVHDVPEAYEQKGPPRAIAYPLLEKILNTLPDVGRAAKNEKRPTASQTKARLLIMAWTGFPPKVIGQIRPVDVDFDAGTVRVMGRRKGKGTKGAILPLLPEAVAAFRLLDQTKAWGSYSASSVRKSLTKACLRVKAELLKAGVPESQAAILDGIRPYDLRHSFATAALHRSGNLRGVSKLMLHADLRTTLQYTEAAVDPLALSVLDAFRPKAETPSGTPDAESDSAGNRK